MSTHIQRTGTKQTHISPLKHQLFDASAQAAQQPWVNLEMHQLSAGKYRGSCNSLSTENLHIVHEQQNQLVQKTGITPKNTCTLSLAFANDPILRFSQFANPMDSWIFYLPEHTEFDVNVPGNIATLYVSLEQDKLLEAARALNEAYWVKPPSGLQAFNSPAAQQLKDDLAALLTTPTTADFSLAAFVSKTGGKMLLDSIMLALNASTEVITGNTPDYLGHRRTLQLVNTARELVDTSLQTGCIPSIVDICTQTGVSQRTLQYAFRQAMQVTPVAYLRILRLNRVRSELLASESPDTTVTRIATTWGFLHLGKFSQDYRRMFGELPSETLARNTPTC